MNIKEIYKKFKDCTGISTDTRTLQKGEMFIALSGENFNGNIFSKKAQEKGAKYIIIDDKKYENQNTILVKNSLKTLQELASYHRDYLGTKIISITGSNGKTTTKELIKATLSKKYNVVATKGNLNNHIGVPLTLLNLKKETEIGIVELGANHKKEIAFLCQIAKPDFGYITNFGKAHLEGFGGIEGVIKGKSELYEYLNNKTIFVNFDDAKQMELTRNSHRVGFSSKEYKDCLLIPFNEKTEKVEVVFQKTKIKSNLIGKYNYTNIAAAICIANYFKVPVSHIKEAITSYEPKNNRSQLLYKGTNTIILDAYNANPSSMECSINNLKKRKGSKILILGDMMEMGMYADEEHQRIMQLAGEIEDCCNYFIGENFSKSANNDYGKFFSCYEDFENYISGISRFEDKTILIKGSRKIALERIINVL